MPKAAIQQPSEHPHQFLNQLFSQCSNQHLRVQDIVGGLRQWGGSHSELVRSIKLLLAHVLKKPHAFLISHDDYVLTDAERAVFKSSIDKLHNGEPLAYIVGSQPFWSLDFLVNTHTLIPRADTEVLVEQGLKAGTALEAELATELKVLDLGTGSGILAICLKHERPSWQVTATDMSSEALNIARQNAKINKVEVGFLQGSWFDALPDTPSQPEKYHLIVSNPPYIAEHDAHLKHLTAEPVTALVAERGGMADIEHIILSAPRYLHEGGWLLIEHGYNQGGVVRESFLDCGFCDVQTITDYGGNERVTLGQWQVRGGVGRVEVDKS